MSALNSLKTASSRAELANLLNFKPSALTYILFKMGDDKKYSEFSIKKKAGGERVISAPSPKLKLLQRRLANLLQDCMEEIQQDSNHHKHLSHGFRREHSIFTNAVRHKARRYVFNIDLEDFFNQFNFGRVRGFFINDRNFSVNEKVATTIAQIACHNNSLPQGSPCSPVITNLIFHICDIRLSALAAKNRCIYTRYADDITFSTNSRFFPEEIARPALDNFDTWLTGTKLELEINRAGFSINREKIRMQYPGSRIDVTGLSANKRVNTKKEYRLNTRSMVHKLITGEKIILDREYDQNNQEDLRIIKSKLSGRLAHIHHIDRLHESYRLSRHNNFAKKQKALSSREDTYRQFLIYSRFASSTKPLILCEGPTDPIYLKCALKSIKEKFPALIEEDELKVDFLKYTSTTANILHLGGGEDNLKKFIDSYLEFISKISLSGLAQPVVILIDNDDGAKGIFARASKLVNSPVDGTESFYRLKHNLYLVSLPRIKAMPTCIEDFFEPKVLSMKHNGKTFSKLNNFSNKTHYGKKIFAEKIVYPNRHSINFSEFTIPLERLQLAIEDYQKISKFEGNT